MRTLHIDDASIKEPLSRSLLERRLERETRARKQAESLLEGKSRELYEAGQTLLKTGRALEAQRAQLNAILDHALAGIILARDDLSIIRANRTALQMFDLRDEDTYQITMLDLIRGPKSARAWIEERLKAEESPSDTVMEAIAQKFGGDGFPVELAVASIPQGGKRQTVWVFRDISRRREEEKRRAALERDLAQAQKLESLGTLASGVAHEINTPIQYISDNTRFLMEALGGLKDVLDCTQELVSAAEGAGFAHEICARIEAKKQEVDLEYLMAEAGPSLDQSLQGLAQVASIVKAIKEFSHPGGDVKASVDINKSILTTLTVLRNHWKYVATVETDLEPDLPVIQALQADVNQVFLNLIMNAADAIKERGLEGLGLLRVCTRQLNDSVEIAISDNGCGISRENIERIYDPFFTTKEVGKGSGQGLAICYNIIRQKHAGAIRCDSELGVGTKFTLTLPIGYPPSEGDSHHE